MTYPMFDVLVVGAGPAGLAAAATAARAGGHVGLLDDNPAPGGQIWRAATTGPAGRWVRAARRNGVILLSRTRVIAPLGPGMLLAETDGAALELRYRRLVLATGARERFLPFPGWTLPGVMGAGGLQALVKGGLPIAGKRVVVAGSGPLLLAVASYLHSKDADVRLIAEQTPWAGLASFARAILRNHAKIAQAVGFSRLLAVPFRAGCWVTHAHGEGRLEAVSLTADGTASSERVDYLACGYGLVPNVELPAAFGCDVVDGAVQVDAWQQTGVAQVYAAGELTGIGGVDAALREGQIAGLAATGRYAEARRLWSRRNHDRQFATALARAFVLRPELRSLPEPATFVCRCEDVPFGVLQGYKGWRAAKLQTRCGMGPCQGRVCGVATTFLFGWEPDSIRPPVTVARLGSLARLDDSREYTQEQML